MTTSSKVLVIRKSTLMFSILRLYSNLIWRGYRHKKDKMYAGKHTFNLYSCQLVNGLRCPIDWTLSLISLYQIKLKWFIQSLLFCPFPLRGDWGWIIFCLSCFCSCGEFPLLAKVQVRKDYLRSLLNHRVKTPIYSNLNIRYYANECKDLIILIIKEWNRIQTSMISKMYMN